MIIVIVTEREEKREESREKRREKLREKREVKRKRTTEWRKKKGREKERRRGEREFPRVKVQNVPVCRFKTPPCVPAKRPHVFNMRAFCQHTRKRFERTLGDVLNLHTGRREGEKSGGRVLFSLFLSSLLSFSLPSFSFSSLFLFSLPSLVFSLFSLSNNDNDHSSSRLSLCTHGSNLPEYQSACTLAHSLFGEHVRIMQETTVLA